MEKEIKYYKLQNKSKKEDLELTKNYNILYFQIRQQEVQHLFEIIIQKKKQFSSFEMIISLFDLLTCPFKLESSQNR